MQPQTRMVIQMSKDRPIIPELFGKIDFIAESLAYSHEDVKEDISTLTVNAVHKWIDLLLEEEFSDEIVREIRVSSDNLIESFKKNRKMAEFLLSAVHEQSAEKKDTKSFFSMSGWWRKKKPEHNLAEIAELAWIVFNLAIFPYRDRLRLNGQPPRDEGGHPESETAGREKHVLTVVVSAKETELLDALQSGHLTPETAHQLFRVKKWLLHSSEEEWKKKCQGLFESSEQEGDEQDVYYIKVETDKQDRRFGRDSSLVKMFDAFKDLGEAKAEIRISGPRPKETYEGKGFYRV